jgi:NAD(P)-dependent dehydrogenase (short-subunit alcohol dehydrogenase family)
MAKNLTGKVALVTGGSRGIGAAGVRAGQSDAAQVDGLVKAVVHRFERLDILVNTAGVFVTGSD